jgi:hypothetical protein
MAQAFPSDCLKLCSLERYHAAFDLQWPFNRDALKQRGEVSMKTRALLVSAFLLSITLPVFAFQTKLDGAYKLTAIKFSGGEQTEAQVKGIMVVHGKHIAFVRSNVGRQMWTQEEPEADRAKKIVAAYQGLAATAGSFEIQGSTITIQQVAQAVPSSMGQPSKWEFKLDGNKLSLRPAGNTQVEFLFERLP